MRRAVAEAEDLAPRTDEAGLVFALQAGAECAQGGGAAAALGGRDLRHSGGRGAGALGVGEDVQPWRAAGAP